MNPTALVIPESPKRRVLFVDDDANLLKALSRSLPVQFPEWDMNFIDSGAKALNFALIWDPHVVVSDQVMPGMDGSTLLRQLRVQNPSALRVILSGSVSSETFDITDVNKRFLAKPMAKEQLKALVAQSARYESLVPDIPLRQAIAKLTCLPLLKQAEQELIAEMDSPDASLRRIAHLVEKDPGLSAMALRAVHKAFLAVQNVEHPMQAALLLGFDKIKAMVLATASTRAFERRLHKLVDQVNQAGVEMALAARLEARKLDADPSLQSEAFSAGLLHSIGKLALASLRPEKTAQWQAMHPDGWPADNAELEHFGATYAGTGAYLLSLWGLPKNVVNAIAWHRNPALGDASPVLDSLASAFSPIQPIIT